MIEEINIAELIKKLCQIYQIQTTRKPLLSLLQRSYSKPPLADPRIFESAFSIFIILIDLKLHNPFIKSLLNFNLNISQIFTIHEIVRPHYQVHALKEFKGKVGKVIKEERKGFVEDLVVKSSKRMIKDIRKGKEVEELLQEEEDRKTSRTDAEELDSDVSLIQTQRVVRKKRRRICCIPIKPTDGRCKR